MKTSDLKTGERYQVGFRGCVKILETGVQRPGFSNGRKDGVKVLFESGAMTGRESIIGCREITRPWEDYHSDQVHARQDYSLLQENLHQLKHQLAEAGVEVTSANIAYQVEHSTLGYLGELRLTGEGVKALKELLAGETEQTKPLTLSQLLS